MTPAEAVAIARVELSAMTLLAALCECAERLPSRHPLQPIVRAALREAVPLDGGER
jgi:hypothetical protein